MIKVLSLTTRSRCEFHDISQKVRDVVRESKVDNGLCHIFVPHTTAAVTINENADPSVQSDILNGLEKLAPREARYAHSEGNASAHIKSSVIGVEKCVLVEGGQLKLGTWQAIYFCEFDGPRHRNYYINVQKD